MPEVDQRRFVRPVKGRFDHIVRAGRGRKVVRVLQVLHPGLRAANRFDIAGRHADQVRGYTYITTIEHPVGDIVLAVAAHHPVIPAWGKITGLDGEPFPWRAVLAAK